MFKGLLLKLAKGILREVLEEVAEQLVKEVKEEIADLEQLTEKERAVAGMVLELVETRAQNLINDKIQ